MRCRLDLGPDTVFGGNGGPLWPRAVTHLQLPSLGSAQEQQVCEPGLQVYWLLEYVVAKSQRVSVVTEGSILAGGRAWQPTSEPRGFAQHIVQES